MPRPAAKARRPNRTPGEKWQRARQREGRDLELYRVAPALEADGYGVTFSHQSKGPYDHVAWKVGQLLVVAARLTKVNLETGAADANPKFAQAELAVLWEFACRSRPGFEVVPLVATALHAAAPDKACRCSGLEPDPVRFLRLTGPPAAQGQRGRWEPWYPDSVAAAA
jgi:hypothetical protein